MLWSPTIIPGCKLWLDAAQITGLNDGAYINMWNDYSGTNNHATQTTVGKQPIYKTNIMNGRPVVRFNRNSLFTKNHFTLNDFTAIVVFAQYNYSQDSYARIIDKNYVNGFMLMQNASVQNSYGGGVLEPNIPYGVFVNCPPTENSILISMRQGTTHKLYRNGTLGTSNTVPATTTSNDIIAIGSWYNDSSDQRLCGDIAEVIVYDSALSDSDRTKLEQYLAWKWQGKSLPTFMGKYLLRRQLDNVIYKYSNTPINNSNWIPASSNNITEDLFKNEGSDCLPTPADIDKLGTVQLLQYLSDITSVPNIKLIGVPVNRLIKPKTDISLLTIEGIDEVKITSTLSNNCKVTLAASVDSGHTWYTYGNGWQTININNLEDMDNYGMTPTIINSLQRTDWDSLIETSSKIRFAYYLSINTSTDIANIDKMEMTVDMRGKWMYDKTADHGYTSNNILTVTLYSNGDYKINY